MRISVNGLPSILISIAALSGCSSTVTHLPRPSEPGTASVSFISGPLSGMGVIIYTGAEKCTDPEVIPKKYKDRLADTVDGPYAFYADRDYSISLDAIRSGRSYVVTCTPTFTARFQDGHAYLVKLVENGTACGAAVFDVTNSNGVVDSSASPVDVRQREYVRPWTKTQGFCK